MLLHYKVISGLHVYLDDMTGFLDQSGGSWNLIFAPFFAFLIFCIAVRLVSDHCFQPQLVFTRSIIMFYFDRRCEDRSALVNSINSISLRDLIENYIPIHVIPLSLLFSCFYLKMLHMSNSKYPSKQIFQLIDLQHGSSNVFLPSFFLYLKWEDVVLVHHSNPDSTSRQQ